jgi:hypothetical protein
MDENNGHIVVFMRKCTVFVIIMRIWQNAKDLAVSLTKCKKRSMMLSEIESIWSKQLGRAFIAAQLISHIGILSELSECQAVA